MVTCTTTASAGWLWGGPRGADDVAFSKHWPQWSAWRARQGAGEKGSINMEGLEMMKEACQQARR